MGWLDTILQEKERQKDIELIGTEQIEYCKAFSLWLQMDLHMHNFDIITSRKDCF